MINTANLGGTQLTPRLPANRVVCGLDEAGRGALAGPLVVAAVLLPRDLDLTQVAVGVVVRDSKDLTNRQRHRLFSIIEEHNVGYDYEVLTVDEINENGINWANVTGFARLIRRNRANEYVVDGRWTLPDLGKKNGRVRCEIGADRRIPSALAAGVTAKVVRDRIMQDLHTEYPEYGWDTNTGHGTKYHISAIREFGSSPFHRLQFVNTALHKHGGCHERI